MSISDLFKSIWYALEVLGGSVRVIIEGMINPLTGGTEQTVIIFSIVVIILFIKFKLSRRRWGR